MQWTQVGLFVEHRKKNRDVRCVAVCRGNSRGLGFQKLLFVNAHLFRECVRSPRLSKGNAGGAASLARPDGRASETIKSSWQHILSILQTGNAFAVATSFQRPGFVRASH